MKTPAVCVVLALWAASAFAQDQPRPSLKIPTIVYASVAGADITTSLLCRPPGCHESNPLIAWMEPQGQATMHITAAAMDAAGVWAWNRYVGRRHPKLAKVGLYVVAAVRVGVAVRNVKVAQSVKRRGS